MWWLGAGLRNLTAGIWKSLNNITCCQDWELLPPPSPTFILETAAYPVSVVVLVASKVAGVTLL